MDTPIRAPPPGYKDSFGKSIDNDVSKWFRNGVKAVGDEQKTGMCSAKATLYILLSISCVIILLVVIIVPVVVANSAKNG